MDKYVHISHVMDVLYKYMAQTQETHLVADGLWTISNKKIKTYFIAEQRCRAEDRAVYIMEYCFE